MTLAAFQYVTYTRDNLTSMFPGEVKGITTFTTPGTELVRFSIGSSGNGSQGTFSLDNVVVELGATFERPIFGATPGDVDGQNGVTIEDYHIIRDHFMQSVTMREEGDLNRDGFVDFRDFRQWKDNFPTPPEGLGVAVLPEAATSLMLLSALVGWLGLRPMHVRGDTDGRR